MSNNTKTYSLSKMKQLIDLNGDITNFDLTFTATSKDGCVFDALVVDQTTLDSNPSLEYKKAEGTISGTIVSDKGVYQNYFLLLKSDTPCECIVSIELKEISKRSSPPPSQQNKKQSVLQVQPKSSINWKLIIIVVIACCILVWFFYGKKPETVILESPSIVDTLVSPIKTEPSTEHVKPISLEQNIDLGSSYNDIPNKSLMDRLSKLKINIT